MFSWLHRFSFNSIFSQEIGKIISDCKVSEKVPDIEIANFKNKVNSDTKEAKCLATCILEKVEIVGY